MIFPWPGRAERLSKLEAAQQALAVQQAKLAEAQRVQQQIETITTLSGNQFARRLAAQLSRGHHQQEQR